MLKLTAAGAKAIAVDEATASESIGEQRANHPISVNPKPEPVSDPAGIDRPNSNVASTPTSPRGETKIAQVIELLQRGDGATLAELVAATDWVEIVEQGQDSKARLGRYPIKKSDPSKPWVKDALPVRIARSALAPNVPHADLYVTAAHCLLIDGVLVPAEMLINGTTITRYEAREYDELEFFHIKLESHDVIYAEGAPAETLLDVDELAVNFAEYFRRYGTPTTEEARCAPHVHIGGGRELKSRFRSALSPWIDLRNQADVVRDQLEERGFVDSRQFETVR